MSEEQPNKSKVESIEEKMRKFYEEKELRARESYQQTLYGESKKLSDEERTKKDLEDLAERKRRKAWREESETPPQVKKSETPPQVKKSETKPEVDDDDFWEKYRKWKQGDDEND